MQLLEFVIYMSKETTAEIYTYFFHILISDVVRIEINFQTDHMDKNATKFNHSVHSPVGMRYDVSISYLIVWLSFFGGLIEPEVQATDIVLEQAQDVDPTCFDHGNGVKTARGSSSITAGVETTLAPTLSALSAVKPGSMHFGRGDEVRFPLYLCPKFYYDSFCDFLQ